MDKLHSAVFIGHADCFSSMSESLIELYLEPLVRNGITNFYCGGMGDFDMYAAHAVDHLKKHYPEIKNILVIPYKNITVPDQKIFDEVIYPFAPGEINNINYRSAIPKRNQYMVNCSAFAVCYVTHKTKGSYKTLEYAKKQNLSIIEIK